MGMMSSKITSLTIVYSTVYLGADQRKHQSSASLAFVRGIHRGPVISHTMDLLWEKFQWILPLYMKSISFQPKASVVCSVTVVIFFDFFLKKLNVFSQHFVKNKTNEYFEFHRTNTQKLKCGSTFCVNYVLRYYLMMQHQPIVKRVNGTHEWAHRPYELLSAPYHCCLYKHMRQDERQHPRAADRCPFVPRHS